jgi:hypothetical protein
MEIYIAQGSTQSGPFTLEEVRNQLQAGTLSAEDHYFHKDLDNWTALSELDFSTINPSPPVPAAGLPSPQNTIPEKLQRDIDDFVEALDHSLGSNMISVVLYGGMVKSTSVKESDPINLMVIVREISTKALDQIAEPYLLSHRNDQLQLLTLSKEDLLRSTDVFPIKFLDMQQDYRILRGEDLVVDLEITRDHLRLRCEQEMKNLMLRLRQTYLAQSQRPKALSGTMVKAYAAFISAADVLCELTTNQVFRSNEEVLNAAEELGLDITPFRRIQALRQGQVFENPDEQKQVYEQLMTTVRKAASLADQL